MSIVTVSESICKNDLHLPSGLPIKVEFLYGDMDEANWWVEQAKKITKDDTVMILLPDKITDSKQSSGLLKSKFPFAAYLLRRHDKPTLEYRTQHVEPEIIKPLRSLARQFMHKLDENELIDKDGPGIVDVDYQPAYGVLDAHLFGVFIQSNIPILESDSIC